MKQFVLKHEIAITWIFAVLRLILQVLAFGLTTLLVIAALYKIFTQFSLPVSANEAIEAISNFVSLWLLFCIIGMVTAFFCNRKGRVIDKIVEIAVASFILEILIFSIGIVIAYYHITDNLFIPFIIYSLFDITIHILRRLCNKILAERYSMV